MRNRLAPRKCRRCRQWFVPSRRDQEYCCGVCKQKSAYLRWKLKEAMKP